MGTLVNISSMRMKNILKSSDESFRPGMAWVFSVAWLKHVEPRMPGGKSWTTKWLKFDNVP